MESMDIRCQICGEDGVKEIKIPGKDIIFYVCDQCIKERECPQCGGRGEINIKHGSDPVEVEMCDLCLGSGEFDYLALE
jgi:DnaJ-class molecular chaperone